MEPPPPSQIMLQVEAAAAPPFFVPISAASLLQSMLSSAAKNSGSQVLDTGVTAVDSKDGVLGGGLPTGSVIGISANTSGGMGRILALRMMCRHLMSLSNRNERAMIIDSTGTFDLQKLVEVAKGCTTREFTKNGVRMVWRERMEVEGLLERVGITRVFDVEGVWDVVGEVRAGRSDEEMQDLERHGEHEEEAKEEGGGGAEMEDAHELEPASMRGGFRQNARIRLPTPDQPPPSTQHAAQSILEVEEVRSDDTQPAHPFAPSAGLPPIPDSPDSPDPPRPVARPPSSQITPPPPSNIGPVDTSSPLSSPLKSPAPSSSLHSELVIEPSPVRQNRHFVLSQAYQGESIPSSPDEEGSEAEPSSLLQAAISPPQPPISPSPLPPSSPPVMHSTTAHTLIPTAGFEAHLATDAAQAPRGSDSDSGSSTSSYISSPSPPRNLLPPGTQWDAPSTTSSPPSLLIIDSLPPLLTNLFGESADRTAAHKQLAQLTRLLTQLTRSTVHPLAVIVLNSTKELSIEEGVLRSVFADVREVPSFGAVYDGMIDLSLLVSKVPARQVDAEALYGHNGVCRYTNVLECLRDDTPDLQRWMGQDGDGDGTGKRRRERPGKRTNREGRWGAFDVVKEESQEGDELMFRDPDLGRKLGEYEVVHFGRRP